MKNQMYCSPIYFDDEPLANSCPILFKLADAGLAELLKYADPVELARQIVPLNFAPLALLEKLKTYSNEGRAGLVCIDRRNVTVRIFWDSEADSCLRELVQLKMNRGFVLGFLVFPAHESFVAYPEAGEDAPVNRLMLETFGRGATASPQVRAADELFNVTSLDEYSAWADRFQDTLIDPISFPDPTHTETGLTGASSDVRR
jgi:hypothetical protein